jgi:hypothetical protein
VLFSARTIKDEFNKSGISSGAMVGRLVGQGVGLETTVAVGSTAIGVAMAGVSVRFGAKVAVAAETGNGMDCEDSLHAVKNINIPRKTPALKRSFMLTRFPR